MSEKRLLLSLFFLFAVATVYLVAVNIRGTDPNGKNWWSLAFTEPTIESSLAFTVTNYTDDAAFQYTITQGSVTLDSGEFSVATGMSENERPKSRLELAPGRITITVTHGGSEETIYRNL